MSVLNLTSEQLRKAADLKENISKLERELAALTGGLAKPNGTNGTAILGRKKKRKISAAGIARIKAAQKARWARVKAATTA